MDLARIARITTGSTLIMAGTAMLVLPGPGLVTIAVGLNVLSKDIPLAGRLKDKAQARINRKA